MGTTWCNSRKKTSIPSHNNPYFYSTSQELLNSMNNPCLTLESACPTSQSSYQGGFGGAQGIAQFLPSTWISHNETIIKFESELGWLSKNKLNCNPPNPYTHPCNPFASLYAMADKLFKDSEKTTCGDGLWTKDEVYRAAGKYFGMYEYNGNKYCEDIVTNMIDRGYEF